jgi:hypothetical protein
MYTKNNHKKAITECTLLAEDQNACATIFARYIHFAAFASLQEKQLTEALQSFKDSPDHSTLTDSIEIIELERGIMTFRDTLTILTDNCIRDIETYFTNKYYLHFESLLCDQRPEGVMLTSYTPIVTNMLQQTGTALFEWGSGRIRKDFRDLCFSKAKMGSKKIVLRSLVRYSRWPLAYICIGYNTKLETVLHAIALFVFQTLQLPKELADLGESWNNGIDRKTIYNGIQGISFKYFENGSLAILFSSKTQATAFREFYALKTTAKA